MRMVGFVVGGVSVAAAACGWQCQHLLQCLLYMVVLLEYGLWRLYRKKRKEEKTEMQRLSDPKLHEV